MIRSARRLAAITTGCTLLALGAGTASASAATTLSPLPQDAPLVNKVYVPVTMTVTCSPNGFPGFPGLPGMLSVTIRQVVQGKQLAYGTASGVVTCDDTPHETTVNVFPDTGGPLAGTPSPPFKKGAAVISAVFSDFSSSVSAGPQSLRLR